MGCQVRVRKEVIREGTTAYVDPDGKTRFLTATPEHIKYWHDSGNAMRAAKLSIPAPLEHDVTAHPMTPAERLLNNAGHVEDFELGTVEEEVGGKKVTKSALFSNVEINSQQAAAAIKDGAIQWTSPWFTSFVDGTGKKWESVIGHLALTSRPRIVNQQPFQAQFSLTPTPFDLSKLPADGVCLSRAGLVSESQAGVFTPVYPVAFSLWTGAKFAFPEDMKKDKGGESEGKKEPKEGGDKEGEKSTGVESSSKEGDGEGGKKPFGKDGAEGGSKPKFDPQTGEPIKEALVDPDGDISVWSVIAYMASVALDVDMPLDDISPENGPEKLLEILQEAVRQKASGQTGVNKPTPNPTDTNGPPPVTPGRGSNPIIQEQQPMYMSLTRAQAEALPDAEKRSIALSIVEARERAEKAEKRQQTYEKNLFNDAKAARARRIAAVAKSMSEADRTNLEALAAGAQFSLSDEGVVIDPVEAWLSILEVQQKSLAAMLTKPSAEWAGLGLSVVPQPEETTGGISAERTKKAREEMLKNNRLAPAAK